MPRETRDKAEMPKAKVYVFLDTNILIRTITQGMPGCEIESWEELKSLAEKNKVTLQGLRTRISRLGALGKLGLPLLYSRAGQESNAFCSIDRQDHTTSSGTSAP